MGNARCGRVTTWLALACVGAWMAGAPPAAAQPVPVQAIAPADSALVRRLDSLVIAGMASERLVGGTLALIRDGTLVTRGYGFVHRDRRAPVDPGRTLFGISSISKTFTAAALLQLAERGRLGLDDPVAPLAPGIALREYDGRAVRVRDLLTHTGGFDDVNIGVAARTPAAVVPLGRYLATEMPAQVRAPGSVTSYSRVPRTAPWPARFRGRAHARQP